MDVEKARIKIDFWFADKGVSKKTQASQRPQFKALLSQVRNGETLVVAKLDRLGRDVQDVGVPRLKRSPNARLKSLSCCLVNWISLHRLES